MQEWVCRQQVGRSGSNFFPNLEKDVCGRHRGYFWKDIVNFMFTKLEIHMVGKTWSIGKAKVSDPCVSWSGVTLIEFS